MAEIEQPSVRDALMAGIKEFGDAPAETVIAEPAAPVEQPVIDEAAAQRARDEKGKFVKTEAAPIAAPQAAPSPTPTSQVTPPAEAASVRKPPVSWSKDLHEHYTKLDPKVQEYIDKREAQFATGVSTYKQIADSAKPLMDAIAPFQQDIERRGMEAPKAVYALLNANRILSSGSPLEKLQFASKLLNDYGIPVQALYDPLAQQHFYNTAPAQQAVAQPQQPAVDINAAVERAILDREIKQTVESMAKDTEKYPFFPYVRNTMSQYIETGEATDLESAYQLAIEAPEHERLRSLAQPQPAQTGVVSAPNAAVVARVARANAISPKSATPAVAAVVEAKNSVRSAVEAAVAQHRPSARV